jgi:hypothetical protein
VAYFVKGRGGFLGRATEGGGERGVRVSFGGGIGGFIRSAMFCWQLYGLAGKTSTSACNLGAAFSLHVQITTPTSDKRCLSINQLHGMVPSLISQQRKAIEPIGYKYLRKLFRKADGKSV